MTTTAAKKVAELEAEIAEKRKALRAARRAEKAAAARALSDAKHGLGVRLADAVGVTTPEEVDALWSVLELDHITSAFQAAQLARNSTTDQAISDTTEVQELDHADATDGDADETEPMTPAERDEAQFEAGISHTASAW